MCLFVTHVSGVVDGHFQWGVIRVQPHQRREAYGREIGQPEVQRGNAEHAKVCERPFFRHFQLSVVASIGERLRYRFFQENSRKKNRKHYILSVSDKRQSENSPRRAKSKPHVLVFCNMSAVFLFYAFFNILFFECTVKNKICNI